MYTDAKSISIKIFFRASNNRAINKLYRIGFQMLRLSKVSVSIGYNKNFWYYEKETILQYFLRIHHKKCVLTYSPYFFLGGALYGFYLPKQIKILRDDKASECVLFMTLWAYWPSTKVRYLAIEMRYTPEKTPQASHPEAFSSRKSSLLITVYLDIYQNLREGKDSRGDVKKEKPPNTMEGKLNLSRMLKMRSGCFHVKCV